MSFWRNEVIEPILDSGTQREIAEQINWIITDPANPRPYYHLAQLYRSQGHQDKALALLLEAVRLNPEFPEAHTALTQIYAVKADYPAAWRHALASKDEDAVALLERHGVPKPTDPTAE